MPVSWATRDLSGRRAALLLTAVVDQDGHCDGVAPMRHTPDERMGDAVAASLRPDCRTPAGVVIRLGQLELPAIPG